MKKIQYFILTKSIGLYLNSISYFNPEKAKSVAYKLFSQPRKGKLKQSHLPKTLQNTTKESFEFQNETIQTYIWPGDQSRILLIHGWESNSSRWKKLLQHLKPLGKTIIAIDGPAHGLSDGKEFNAPKYAEFIHTVIQKYPSEVVIGHSIGGAAIAFYLHKYKNPAIQKVVLLASPSDFKIISNNFVSLLSLNKKIKSLLEKYYHKKFDIHIDDFAGHLFAEQFPQKALIAHDQDDKIVSVNEGRKYASRWKNATYIETKGHGHSLHDNDLYQSVISFITES